MEDLADVRDAGPSPQILIPRIYLRTKYCEEAHKRVEVFMARGWDFYRIGMEYPMTI